MKIANQTLFPGHLICTTGSNPAQQSAFCDALARQIVGDFPPTCLLQVNRRSAQSTLDLIVSSLATGRVVICPCIESELLDTPAVGAATVHIDFDTLDDQSNDALPLQSMIETIHQTLLTQEAAT